MKNIFTNKRRKYKTSQILSGGFALIILLGSVLLMLPIATTDGSGAEFIPALFTATSATCVTGLAVFDTGSYFTLFGQIVILVLIQIGGLGFMSVTTLVALMLRRRVSLKNKMLVRSSFSADNVNDVMRFVKNVMRFTFAAEGLGAIFFAFVFVPEYGARGIYYSIFHSVSGFCNAGFDVLGTGTSFSRYVDNPIVNITTMLLIVLGGIGFTVVQDLFAKAKDRHSRLELHTKLVLTTTAVLLTLGFAVILASEQGNPDTLGRLSPIGKILSAMFASVTARTAGFFTIDYASVTPVTFIMTIILMLIGASPGSTGGGIKTSTIAVILLVVYRTARGEADVNAFGRRIPEHTVRRALVLCALPLLWVLSAVLLLCAVEPLPLGDIVFEVCSAIGTVGLSTGITASLGSFGKIIITLTMFFGRVGLMTVAYALSHAREDVKITDAPYHYPDGMILM